MDPVAFTNAEFQPILEAYHLISFGCGSSDDDVLSRVASDSEDLVGESCYSLPPSGEEKYPSPSYNESLDVLTRAVGHGWTASQFKIRPSRNWMTDF